jgi:hypothetical protein
MPAPQPVIGAWYRQTGGASFEIVAIDEDDATIEIQYFDGTVEELDLEDWNTQWDEGLLEAAEAPEDFSGSIDVEPEENVRNSDDYDADRRLGASPLDGLDLFE